jgi:phospho-N-acetylmuramoyl-pentapeptide-transferase
MVGILIGGAVAFVASFIGTPVLIRWLKAAGIGQPIHESVVQHSAKAGTPTMGGLVIPLGLVVGYPLACAVSGTAVSEKALTVVATVVGGCIVGVVDDWLKVHRGRNLGLREAQKTSMQALVIIGFCVAYLHGPNPCTHLSVTSCSTIAWNPGPVGWSVFAAVLLWATCNGVNFTDGIEGLLSGSAALSFFVLAVVGFYEYRNPREYHLHGALGLAIVAAALAAACVGFLWWNIRPTTIFMGDSGSLAIGMGIAALALSLRVALLVPVFGVVYVMEGGSSALQRYTYKIYFKPRGGARRLFRMAPLHHHFELAGWSEPTIVIRFWVMSAIGAAAALGIFYGSSISPH